MMLNAPESIKTIHFNPFTLLVISLLSICGLAAEKAPPNVLFIAIDDLNDLVGFLDDYPGVKTPHLDRLAARGVNFRNAHCAAPGCAPSRTAVLTGIHPTKSGVYVNRDDWRDNPITRDGLSLPGLFQNNGYLTRGGGKIYHAHTLNEAALGGYIDPRPWNSFFPSKDRQMPREPKPAGWPDNAKTKYYGSHFDWAALELEESEMADAKVVTWAEGQLKTRHEKPLFLAVGIYRPHIPWWTPKKYFEMHPLDQITLPEVPADDVDDIPKAGRAMARIHWQKTVTDAGEWRAAAQGYLASMSFADAMVGRLVAALDAGPMADNTILVLWSDHGYHIGHKQHWEKFALWEQATHVPLLFADTRKPEGDAPKAWAGGTTCDQAVSLLDVYPTLAEICQLAPPKHLDGKSLLPLLKKPTQQTGRAVVTTHGFMNHAVRSDRWRYIRYADGSEELYDHAADSEEFTNLADEAEHAAIKTSLSVWLPKTNHPRPDRPPRTRK